MQLFYQVVIFGSGDSAAVMPSFSPFQLVLQKFMGRNVFFMLLICVFLLSPDQCVFADEFSNLRTHSTIMNGNEVEEAPLQHSKSAGDLVVEKHDLSGTKPSEELGQVGRFIYLPFLSVFCRT